MRRRLRGLNILNDEKLTKRGNERRIGLWTTGLLLILTTGCDMQNWKTEETNNLDIYYKPGSYAEQNLEAAKKAYENSFAVAEQFLPTINKLPKVKVFLYDTLKAKGFSKVKEREVHYRYSEEFRLTSVHEFLHIFLYELNPNVPLRFEEGVCRIREGKAKKFKGQHYHIMYYQLVKLTPPERWKVDEVFQDNYQDDDEGNIAAAFALFATRRIGEERFWKFYRELDKTNYKVQLKKYFGKDPAALDPEFATFIHAIPDPPEAFRYKFSPETAELHR